MRAGARPAAVAAPDAAGWNSRHRLIASIHQLDPERRRRDRAITDFHFYNFACVAPASAPSRPTMTPCRRFAKSQCFTHEQISAFYSMAAQVMVDDQQQAFCRSADSFARFKRLLLHHAVDRPPSRCAAHSPVRSP